MARDNFKDLLALIAIVREGSFTRAAAKLGVSQSALSHTIRGLEATLGLRLLTRTTRSVAPTEAGERLIQTVAPRFAEIEEALSALSEMRDTPAGSVRITATDYAAREILWPKLAVLLRQYPDIKVELVVDNGLTDIVADRYDLGVRLGDQVEKDMIAARIAPDMRMALIASPAYLERRPLPRTPQDLTAHLCINLRMTSAGGILRLGTGKGRPRDRGARGGPAHLQQHLRSAGCGAAGVRHCLRAGRPGAAAHQGRAAALGDEGLVTHLARPACVLPQPPAFLARVQPGAGGAAA